MGMTHDHAQMPPRAKLEVIRFPNLAVGISFKARKRARFSSAANSPQFRRFVVHLQFDDCSYAVIVLRGSLSGGSNFTFLFPDIRRMFFL